MRACRAVDIVNAQQHHRGTLGHHMFTGEDGRAYLARKVNDYNDRPYYVPDNAYVLYDLNGTPLGVCSEEFFRSVYVEIP